MSRRHELHHLVKNLRQYLQWQAVPLSGAVGAPSADREAFETGRSSRQRETLARTLEGPKAPTIASVPPIADAKPKPPAVAKPALWKDERLSRGPRKTFAPSPSASPSVETLDDIRTDLGECTRCALCADRKTIVFGAGAADARVMFVGEMPGFDEDMQGVPFVGKAGELLDKMIVAMTLSRDTVYVANVIKCRPPSNRDPEPAEIAACAPFLQRQVAAVQPEVIVALGKFASNMLSGTDGPLNEIRGQWQQWNGVPVMPTFHPAYLLRTPADKGLAWEDLKKVMARLNLSVPKSR